MRIALTHAQDGPAPDADRYASDLVGGLLGAGHEVHVYAPASPWSKGLDPRATAHRVPDPWKSIAFMRAWSFDRWLTRKVRRADFDVVHGLSLSSHSDVTSLGGAPLATPSEPAPGRRGTLLQRQLRAIEARRYARDPSRRILAPSRAAADALRRRFDLAESDVVVSRPGPDLARFTTDLRAQWNASYRERIAASPATFIVLCLTHSYRDANVPVLIDVCRRLKERGLKDGRAMRFGMVGREKKPLEHEMSELCKARGVYDHFKFYGPQDLPERWLAMADLMVLPASAEGAFARAPLEAMACGVPAIVSRAVAASEVIESGRNGHVIDDPTDASRLVDLIADLAGDEAARLRLGRAARETAEGWSLSRHVGEVLAVYEQVAAGKGLALTR
jgi:glycosyltransferase involved in cell wall biosynthesis